MANITVSNDIDTFLQSANNTAARSNLGILEFYNSIGTVEPVAPAVGHRWFETSINQGWYWNGSLWIGIEQLVYQNVTQLISISNSSHVLGDFLASASTIFVERATFAYTLASAGTGENYWEIGQLRFGKMTSFLTAMEGMVIILVNPVEGIKTPILDANQIDRKNYLINQSVSLVSLNRLGISLFKFGSVGNMNGYISVFFRRVR